jgi:hypothetical protein
MSYDICFKVKVEGLKDRYVDVFDCDAKATWNLRDMIVNSTGLEWNNEENNGLCKDVIPRISHGLCELISYPEKYKQYEAENGWGTIYTCKKFFSSILNAWSEFCNDSYTSDLADITYFWIM